VTLEANKQVAVGWFNAISEGKLDQALAVMADDIDFWIAPSTIASGTHDKQGFMRLVENLGKKSAGPLTFAIGEVMAEDDRVHVTAKGHMPLKNGKVYATDYSFLFEIRDGVIVRAREYIDTSHYNDVFAGL
jgi:uncharacterized protein